MRHAEEWSLPPRMMSPTARLFLLVARLSWPWWVVRAATSRPSATSFIAVAIRADGSRSQGPPPLTALRINEVMTGNDGAWVDEVGETDDFVELINTGRARCSLGDYSAERQVRQGDAAARNDARAGRHGAALGRRHAGAGPAALAVQALGLGHAAWCCGRRYVPARRPGEGAGAAALGELRAVARRRRGASSICRYATPERENGDRPASRPIRPQPAATTCSFAAYEWPEPFLGHRTGRWSCPSWRCGPRGSSRC